MKFALASLTTLALAAAAYAQSFMINTPTNVVQCQPILITWTGGMGPYFLSVLPGGQPSAPALVDLGEQQGTSFSWTVNVGAGASVGLTLRDSTGAVAQSAPFTINPGSSNACLTAAPSGTTSSGSDSSGGSSTTATTPATTGASTTGPASVTSTSALSVPGVTQPSKTSTGTGTSTSSSSARPSTSSSAANPNAVSSFGAAGLMAAAVAAVFA